MTASERDWYLRLLRANAPYVRWHAAEAQGKIGDARAVPALIQALRDDDDTDVQQSAQEALNTIRR